MTRDEYDKTLTRIFNSMRDSKYNNYPICKGTECLNCLLNPLCSGTNSIHSAYDIVAFVEQWAKEHPVVTKADKFRETFGYFPIYDGEYCCPLEVGASIKCGSDCENCPKSFWESEYVGPEKE